MKKYYVRYTENCKPELKRFKTLKAAKSFVIQFNKENAATMESCWVDYIVAGELLEVDEYFSDQV